MGWKGGLGTGGLNQLHGKTPPIPCSTTKDESMSCWVAKTPESFGSRTAHFSPPALPGAHGEAPRTGADQPPSEVKATGDANAQRIRH
ncbi:hypothetical protein IRJ41_010800 [Triplophysa rosa]|uniref:G-patch domain-containing protein n=1 Tax=Triplophysa rosa TaxID=992332 RepID=A0A9W7WL06_TRIRA|nr:hypothetical protein IRJ41_010800 [Triplophysa rosa]